MISQRAATPKLSLLVSPIYVFAVVGLLLNDFVLKRCWPSVITGKLSDVCGLFALAVVMLVIARSRWILVALAVCFALWKSPFPEGVIQFCNAATGVGIGRTVDLTDLTALAVLPLSLLYFRTAETGRIPRRWCCTVSSIVSLFAFAATSRPMTPQQEAAFHAAVAEFTFSEIQPSYSFALKRKNLYRAIESLGFYVSGSTALYPDPGKRSAYLTPRPMPLLGNRSGKAELFGAGFDVDDSNRGVTIRVTKLSIKRGSQSVSRSDALHIFETLVVAPLRRTGASISTPCDLRLVGSICGVSKPAGLTRSRKNDLGDRPCWM
jgi:hypothetical protein